MAILSILTCMHSGISCNHSKVEIEDVNNQVNFIKKLKLFPLKCTCTVFPLLSTPTTLNERNTKEFNKTCEMKNILWYQLLSTFSFFIQCTLSQITRRLSKCNWVAFLIVNISELEKKKWWIVYGVLNCYFSTLWQLYM